MDNNREQKNICNRTFKKLGIVLIVYQLKIIKLCMEKVINLIFHKETLSWSS